MLPTITIDGRAVADPDLRFTAGGRGVANLRVAANDSRKLDDGTWENTEQLFVSCPIWNTDRQPAVAEFIAENIHKGDHVIVTGRIHQREWEKDGEKRTSLELKFATVSKVLDPPKQGQSGGGWGQSAPAASQAAALPASDPWGTPAGGGDEPPF